MGDREEPPVVIHHQNLKFNRTTTLPQFKVVYRDPVTGVWKGPVPVIFNGRGYMCVSTDRRPVWVPSRVVKPALERRDQAGSQDDENPDSGDNNPDNDGSSSH